MAKLARASPPIRNLVMALALMSGGTAAALAQDATTTTPPELRDFRLDPPPAEREPPPEATPPTDAAPSPVPTPARPTPVPVLVPPVASTSPRTQARPSARAQRTESPSRQETQPASKPASEPRAEALTTSPPAETEPVERPSPASDELNRIGGMIMLLFLTVAGAFYYYRRRTKAALAPMRPAAHVKPPPRPKPRQAPLKPASTPPTPPHPTRAIIATAKPAAPPPQSPLSMTFVPDKAVVSLANLVVRGQLQVANEGPAIIHGLALHAALIAASTQQQQAIDSFFADPRRIPPSPVGALNPGERIGLTLELSVALNEMQTFMLGDQILLVPILLAVLSYENAASQQDTQLVCMIGREASPPTAKMGPLRLDLGPRTFGRLGQRSLLA